MPSSKLLRKSIKLLADTTIIQVRKVVSEMAVSGHQQICRCQLLCGLWRNQLEQRSDWVSQWHASSPSENSGKIPKVFVSDAAATNFFVVYISVGRNKFLSKNQYVIKPLLVADGAEQSTPSVSYDFRTCICVSKIRHNGDGPCNGNRAQCTSPEYLAKRKFMDL